MRSKNWFGFKIIQTANTKPGRLLPHLVLPPPKATGWVFGGPAANDEIGPVVRHCRTIPETPFRPTGAVAVRLTLSLR